MHEPLPRTASYGKRFESVGVLLDRRVSNCPEGHAKKRVNCWISLHVDEVGRVHMFQRKREEEGRFRGDLASKQGHLVHILPEVRNRQERPTDARRSAEAPSVESV